MGSFEGYIGGVFARYNRLNRVFFTFFDVNAEFLEIMTNGFNFLKKNSGA